MALSRLSFLSTSLGTLDGTLDAHRIEVDDGAISGENNTRITVVALAKFTRPKFVDAPGSSVASANDDTGGISELLAPGSDNKRRERYCSANLATAGGQDFGKEHSRLNCWSCYDCRECRRH
jgi:hypothetical protein